jgi:hypothetical protein
MVSNDISGRSFKSKNCFISYWVSFKNFTSIREKIKKKTSEYRQNYQPTEEQKKKWARTAYLNKKAKLEKEKFEKNNFENENIL